MLCRVSLCHDGPVADLTFLLPLSQFEYDYSLQNELEIHLGGSGRNHAVTVFPMTRSLKLRHILPQAPPMTIRTRSSEHANPSPGHGDPYHCRELA